MAAAAIPLLIHLFAKRKPQVIVFSTIRYIQNSVQKQNRRINLKNFLLLLIRTLIILFTVLALARPTVKLSFLKSSARHPRTAVAIIIDNSYSMEYLVDTSTALDIARKNAKAAGDLLNESDFSVLMTLDNQWNSLYSYLKGGKPDEKTIQNIEISPLTISPEEAVAKAEEFLKESQLPNREIWLFTDRQAQDYPKATDTPLYVIRSGGYETQNNISCQNARLDIALVDRTLSHNLQFEAVNHSPEAQHGIICQLILDGRTIAEQAIDIEPEQTKSSTFRINLERPGWHSGYVSVKNERLLYDNRNWFTFYYEPSPKIGIITDLPQLPLALETIMDVFAGQGGTIDFLEDNLSNEDIVPYQVIMIYRKAYSHRLDFLLQNTANKTLFVADSLLSDDWRNHLLEVTGINLTDFHDKSPRTIDQISAWHPITAVFDQTQLKKTRINGFWESKSENILGDVLLQAGNAPLVLATVKGLFWTFDPADLDDPFLLDSAFPVLAYRCLQYQSTSGLLTQDLQVGDLYPRGSRAVKLPEGSEIRLSGSDAILTQPGIYSNLENDTRFAVNLRYDESRFQPASEEGENIFWLDEDWQQEILASRYGFELWKYLLIAALALFFLEMLLVRHMERMGETQK